MKQLFLGIYLALSYLGGLGTLLFSTHMLVARETDREQKVLLIFLILASLLLLTGVYVFLIKPIITKNTKRAKSLTMEIFND